MSNPTYYLSNLLLVLAAYLAVASDLAWLKYGLVSFVWFQLFIYIFVLYLKLARVERTPDSRPAPSWFVWAIDITVVVLFLWSGWYVTTLAYVASCVVLAAVESLPRLP